MCAVWLPKRPKSTSACTRVPANFRLRAKNPMAAESQGPHESLFSPIAIGGAALSNRIALASMTRVSATVDGLPTDRIAGHYRNFADGGFGLLITEGLYIDHNTSQGYTCQPGIANPAQSQAWRRVVDGVHAAGAKFFAQLMHAGSQSQGNPHTTATWGPSAIRPKGEQLAMHR